MCMQNTTTIHITILWKLGRCILWWFTCKSMRPIVCGFLIKLGILILPWGWKIWDINFELNDIHKYLTDYFVIISIHDWAINFVMMTNWDWLINVVAIFMQTFTIIRFGISLGTWPMDFETIYIQRWAFICVMISNGACSIHSAMIHANLEY